MPNPNNNTSSTAVETDRLFRSLREEPWYQELVLARNEETARGPYTHVIQPGVEPVEVEQPEPALLIGHPKSSAYLDTFIRTFYEDHDDEGFSRPVGCDCETCRLIRAEESKIQNSVVHRYSFVPDGGWQMHQVESDWFGPRAPYYLGIELETDNIEGIITSKAAADMRRPYDFWIAARDRSVSGPEFKSQPATLAWWKEHQPEVKQMFTMLLHAGFRSHIGGHAGMHVNISRNAFDNAEHFYRFVTLIHVDPRWTLIMSQRAIKNLNKWAKLDSFRGLHGMHKGQVDMAWRYAMTLDGSDERHVALNVPGVERFEFRIPRGSLRIDRFFKNLEWVAAMIEYTRTSAFAGCRPKRFMRWVDERQDEYPNLASFIKDRQDKFAEKRPVHVVTEGDDE